MTVCGDYALWGDLVGKTQFANIQHVLVRYRVHKNNTTRRLAKTCLADSAAVVRKYRLNFPHIWERAQHSVIIETQYKLFGAVPIVTIKAQGRRKKYLLFNLIPILTSRRREELFKPF
jgi:hypothetical protein